MWNRIPRVLRTRLAVFSLAFVVITPLLFAPALLAAGLGAEPTSSTASPLIHAALPQVRTSISSPTAPAAATCGDIVINEVLFNGDDEWVELYVVNTLAAGTVIKVEDNDSGATDFVAEFTLPAEIVADRYIVVHGSDEANSQEPAIGKLNIFEAGDGNADLTNSNENIALSVGGTLCEEVYWESTSGSNSPAFAAPTTVVFTGSGPVGNGESIQRSPNGPSGSFVRGTTPGQYNEVEGHNIGRNNLDGTLAVTLGWFQATRAGDMVNFAWQTATESGNAGFNLLAETEEGRLQLNDTLIPSTVIDSIVPIDYGFSAATPAEQFYIQEVGIDGKRSDLGPFAIGETYGSYTATPHAIDSPHGGPTLYLPLVER